MNPFESHVLRESLDYRVIRTAHKLGCVMAEVTDPECVSMVRRMQSTLTGLTTDIEDKPGHVQAGLQQDLHVTVLYGLESGKIDDQAVRDIMDTDDIQVELKSVEYFRRPEREFDVLVLACESPDLRRLSGELRELPNQNEFPDYKPHLTLAYIKKGAVAPEAATREFSPMTVKIKRVLYSKPKDTP